MTTTTYVDTADVAKLVRKQLKVAFPDTKFSVKSKRYSGGSSIGVYWTDGPTTRQVRNHTDRFEGASFDGMIDLKEYHDVLLADGSILRYGADFVTPYRKLSYGLLESAIAHVAKDWGWTGDDVPTIVGSDEFGYHVQSNDFEKERLVHRYIEGLGY